MMKDQSFKIRQGLLTPYLSVVRGVRLPNTNDRYRITGCFIHMDLEQLKDVGVKRKKLN